MRTLRHREVKQPTLAFTASKGQGCYWTQAGDSIASCLSFLHPLTPEIWVTRHGNSQFNLGEKDKRWLFSGSDYRCAAWLEAHSSPGPNQATATWCPPVSVNPGFPSPRPHPLSIPVILRPPSFLPFARFACGLNLKNHPSDPGLTPAGFCYDNNSPDSYDMILNCVPHHERGILVFIQVSAIDQCPTGNEVLFLGVQWALCLNLQSQPWRCLPSWHCHPHLACSPRIFHQDLPSLIFLCTLPEALSSLPGVS